jgi:hypothetical protein
MENAMVLGLKRQPTVPNEQRLVKSGLLWSAARQNFATIIAWHSANTTSQYNHGESFRTITEHPIIDRAPPIHHLGTS